MAWKTSYYHYDALGSTRMLTDENQAVTDTYDYDGYGNEIASSGSTKNPFRYVGERGYYTDADTGTINVRARDYEPSIIRWLSQDPLGYPGSFNLYNYVDAQPTVASDPIGLMPPAPRFRPPPRPKLKQKCKDYGGGCKECQIDEIKLICRKMPALYGYGLRHCSLMLIGKDGKPIESISGQRDEETGAIVWADPWWDRNHYKDPNDGLDDREYPFSTGDKDVCSFYDCACKAAINLTGAWWYGQFQNNSNRFLTEIIRKCGGSADFPWSAWGSDDLAAPS